MRLERFRDTDWQGILEGIAEDIRPRLSEGKVADYIPALADQDPSSFAMAFIDLEGRSASVGEADRRFPVQSISKVFSLTLALELEGEALWQRVGREPSGSPFNSVVQLEKEEGKPRNPLINAGAIVVTDTLVAAYGPDDAFERLRRFFREAADDDTIGIDEKVAASETEHGDRNRALAYFMKSFGVLKTACPDSLDVYFRQCAIEMNVRQLARAALFLVNDGTDPLTGRVVTSRQRADRVVSIMMLCGHYDMSGDFAFRVGLAGKSGVAGGILALIPGVGAVCVWSPGLNRAGNSHAGTIALEMFSGRSGVNLF